MKDSNPKDAIGADKLPLHLWPPAATAMGSIGLAEGMLKYGRANWRAAGVRASIYYDACRRHLDAWFEGEEVAPDSGVPHLANALACLAIIVDAKAAGKLTDDRNFGGAGYRTLVEELTPHVARLKALHAGKSPTHYSALAETGHYGEPLPSVEQLRAELKWPRGAQWFAINADGDGMFYSELPVWKEDDGRRVNFWKAPRGDTMTWDAGYFDPVLWPRGESALFERPGAVEPRRFDRPLPGALEWPRDVPEARWFAIHPDGTADFLSRCPESWHPDAGWTLTGDVWPISGGFRAEDAADSLRRRRRPDCP